MSMKAGYSDPLPCRLTWTVKVTLVPTDGDQDMARVHHGPAAGGDPPVAISVAFEVTSTEKVACLPRS